MVALYIYEWGSEGMTDAAAQITQLEKKVAELEADKQKMNEVKRHVKWGRSSGNGFTSCRSSFGPRVDDEMYLILAVRSIVRRRSSGNGFNPCRSSYRRQVKLKKLISSCRSPSKRAKK